MVITLDTSDATSLVSSQGSGTGSLISPPRRARLCVVSDVHADVHALQDALTQAGRLGCAIVVCAGDLVDYGLFPEEAIALLRARQVPCIRGNHDRWAVGWGWADAPGEGVEAEAYDASGWGLSSSAVAFLASLPSSWTAVIEGVRVAVHHGSPSPGSDMVGILPDQLTPELGRQLLGRAAADVLLLGHTHVPFSYAVPGGGLIANPGALLCEESTRRDGELGRMRVAHKGWYRRQACAAAGVADRLGDDLGELGRALWSSSMGHRTAIVRAWWREADQGCRGQVGVGPDVTTSGFDSRDVWQRVAAA